MKLDVEVPHTDTSAVSIKVSTTDYFNNEWGIKGYYMMVGLCHPYCDACTGGDVDQCTSCIPNYWLSGTTCDTACLDQYGPSGTPYECILCDYLCSECEIVGSNCSACQPSGANESFLFDSNNTCILACPDGYV